jgi:protein SCO1/2
VACVQGHTSSGRTAPNAAEVSAGSADDGSIYDVPVTLTDASGRRLALADLHDHVLVASMIYTACTSVCPRVAEDMKAIQGALPASIADDVTFAMFSLDPGRDTPTALQTFAAMHDLDARWRLFATSEDDVRTLAALFGVKYVREDSGAFAHSATVVVIDRDGAVRHRQIGLNDGPKPVVDAIRASVRSRQA